MEKELPMKIEASTIIKQEKYRIISFFDKHSSVYLYGAGIIGKKYLNLLRKWGMEPAGFIITKGKMSFYQGLPIYPLDSIKNGLIQDVGIIGAFLGATEDLILDLIGFSLDVICVSNGETSQLLALDAFSEDLLKGIPLAQNTITENYSWKSILIVQLAVLGDSIITTPFIRELRRNCPKSHITLIVRRENELLFRHCPYISELLLYDMDPKGGLSLNSEENIHLAREHAEIFFQ